MIKHVFMFIVRERLCHIYYVVTDYLNWHVVYQPYSQVRTFQSCWPRQLADKMLRYYRNRENNGVLFESCGAMQRFGLNRT